VSTIDDADRGIQTEFDPRFVVVKAQEQRIGDLLRADRIRGLLVVLETW
jgi:hypothetical protein